MKDSYLFVIGTNPYENSHGDYHTKGNGEWHTTAATLEEALCIIVNSMDFPSEPTGRKMFVPGVSLQGVSSEDVIQVWSNRPGILERTAKALGEEDTRECHDGRGHSFGLDCEVKVGDLDKYLQPTRALLADAPADDKPNETTTVMSPLAASVHKYQAVKHEIKMAVQVQKWEVTRKEWEVKALSDNLRGKVRAMQEQIAVFDAYLHGTRHRTQLCRGSKSHGKYVVFQERVFLSEEIAILGNFEDMDFQGMEAFEKWLVNSGHVWKLLPHERCILATRIRQERKEYADPMMNVWRNMENMRNIIWIRDGQNVFHVDVEYDFHNAIFPAKDQFERTKRVAQDHVWKQAFQWQEPTNWHGAKLKEGEYDVMGQMRRKPLEEEEPYFTQRTLKRRFHTMEEWLDSDCYTPLLDQQIGGAVRDYLRERNKKQMVFAVIMQGIVDNTSYLDIPKGTDMFNWENVDLYMSLTDTYTHGLEWKGWREKIAPYIMPAVSVGDWLVAYVNEYVLQPGRITGKSYTETRPILFRVVGTEDCTYDKMGIGEKTTIARPVVNYCPVSKRWNRVTQSYCNRTKTPIKLTLKSSSFIRVPMSLHYAKDILNDREWKKNNRRFVSLMVNYDKIIAAMKSPVNGTILNWKGQDDE
jgi:hypothetical protein